MPLYLCSLYMYSVHVSSGLFAPVMCFKNYVHVHVHDFACFGLL